MSNDAKSAYWREVFDRHTHKKCSNIFVIVLNQLLVKIDPLNDSLWKAGDPWIQKFRLLALILGGEKLRKIKTKQSRIKLKMLW